MEDTITTLRMQRKTLSEKLVQIDAAIAQYEKWAASVNDLIGPVSHAVGHRMTSMEKSHTPALDEHKEVSSIREFEDAVRLILQETTHPMQRAAIMGALDDLGIVVGGKEPANTAATRLNRMSGVVNLKGYGYWLDGRLYAPAGYLLEQGAGVNPVSDTGSSSVMD